MLGIFAQKIARYIYLYVLYTIMQYIEYLWLINIGGRSTSKNVNYLIN